MAKLVIRKQLKNNTPFKNKAKNSKRFITIHETANTQNGADAGAHANLQSNGNTREAAWHWQVDDHEAVQSFDHDLSLWHAGAGNSVSIAIEICVNRDGDYVKAVNNAAALVRHICSVEGIPIANVVQHNKWTGKNCPTGLRTGRGGMTWDKFIGLVKGAAPRPVESVAKPGTYKGDSIVMYLKSRGIDHSFNNRVKLAKTYGIAGTYKGTAKQNLDLLHNMHNDKKAPAVKSNDVIAREVIAGKWGNGQERSRRLNAAGYNSVAIQNRVNALLK